MNKCYLFYLQVGFPPPPEVQCLTDKIKKKKKNQREMSHQHSPSLNLGLMALRGITVRIFFHQRTQGQVF